MCVALLGNGRAADALREQGYDVAAVDARPVVGAALAHR
jgi:hypothetical protein